MRNRDGQVYCVKCKMWCVSDQHVDRNRRVNPHVASTHEDNKDTAAATTATNHATEPHMNGTQEHDNDESDPEPVMSPRAFQARQQQRQSASDKMGQKLLQGWKMLAETCPNPECVGIPLMEDHSGTMQCVNCEAVIVRDTEYDPAVHGPAENVPSSTNSSQNQRQAQTRESKTAAVRDLGVQDDVDMTEEELEELDARIRSQLSRGLDDIWLDKRGSESKESDTQQQQSLQQVEEQQTIDVSPPASPSSAAYRPKPAVNPASIPGLFGARILNDVVRNTDEKVSHSPAVAGTNSHEPRRQYTPAQVPGLSREVSIVRQKMSECANLLAGLSCTSNPNDLQSIQVHAETIGALAAALSQLQELSPL
jgi:uncharacterized Zn finger protein (UPF0148 family)